MTNLTYLSSLIASLVLGGSDDHPSLIVLYQEVVMTILTYLSNLKLVLYQEILMTFLTHLSSLIACLVSGGSDDQPNIFK